ncbi:hypothetical protein D5086_033992, partial [Populus alba]
GLPRPSPALPCPPHGLRRRPVGPLPWHRPPFGRRRRLPGSRGLPALPRPPFGPLGPRRRPAAPLLPSPRSFAAGPVCLSPPSPPPPCFSRPKGPPALPRPCLSAPGLAVGLPRPSPRPHAFAVCGPAVWCRPRRRRSLLPRAPPPFPAPAFRPPGPRRGLPRPSSVPRSRILRRQAGRPVVPGPVAACPFGRRAHRSSDISQQPLTPTSSAAASLLRPRPLLAAPLPSRPPFCVAGRVLCRPRRRRLLLPRAPPPFPGPWLPFGPRGLAVGLPPLSPPRRFPFCLASPCGPPSPPPPAAPPPARAFPGPLPFSPPGPRRRARRAPRAAPRRLPRPCLSHPVGRATTAVRVPRSRASLPPFVAPFSAHRLPPSRVRPGRFVPAARLSLARLRPSRPPRVCLPARGLASPGPLPRLCGPPAPRGPLALPPGHLSRCAARPCARCRPRNTVSAHVACRPAAARPRRGLPPTLPHLAFRPPGRLERRPAGSSPALSPRHPPALRPLPGPRGPRRRTSRPSASPRSALCGRPSCRASPPGGLPPRAPAFRLPRLPRRRLPTPPRVPRLLPVCGRFCCRLVAAGYFPRSRGAPSRALSPFASPQPRRSPAPP